MSNCKVFRRTEDLRFLCINENHLRYIIDSSAQQNSDHVPSDDSDHVPSDSYHVPCFPRDLGAGGLFNSLP